MMLLRPDGVTPAADDVIEFSAITLAQVDFDAWLLRENRRGQRGRRFRCASNAACGALLVKALPGKLVIDMVQIYIFFDCKMLVIQDY